MSYSRAVACRTYALAASRRLGQLHASQHRAWRSPGIISIKHPQSRDAIPRQICYAPTYARNSEQGAPDRRPWSPRSVKRQQPWRHRECKEGGGGSGPGSIWGRQGKGSSQKRAGGSSELMQLRCPESPPQRAEGSSELLRAWASLDQPAASRTDGEGRRCRDKLGPERKKWPRRPRMGT